MIKKIIFDVGGTLVKAPDIFKEIAINIKREHNINVELELKKEFEKIYTGPSFYDVKTILNNITKDILKNKGITQTEIDPSKIYFDIFVNKSELFEDSVRILDYLKTNKIKLMILSDADSDVLLMELEKLGIIKFFEKIVISSDIKCYKTSKDIKTHINPLLSEQKENILFVGDSFADIYAAKNLNIKSVFINRHSNEQKGDITINSLLDIKKII